MNLRPYQQRAIADLRATYAAGKRAPCLVLPTGAGKTVIAAEIIRSARERNNRTLFLVHRQELLAQSVAKLEGAGLTDLRIIQAGHDLGSPTAPIAVASIPTLTRWTDRQPQADLVIVDEAHHVVAKTWKRLADHYASARILGLTATPQRADGRPLGDVFDSIVVGATVKELTDLGHLVPCRVFAPLDKLDTNQIAVSPVEAYRRHGDNARAVIFCITVEHARRCAAEMNAAGIPTGVVHGSMPGDERRYVLAALDSGRLTAVASCHVLTEGWDSPRVAVCILARKPQHAELYLQMVGRVLRPADGKTQATLIDLCGSVHDHGPPDIDRTFTLDGKGISKIDRKSLRQCASCGGVFVVGPQACPMCGLTLPRREQEMPSAIGADLIDLSNLPRLPLRKYTLSITAKFASRCRRCRGSISIGEQILWTKGEKAEHVNCEEVAA